MHQTNSPKTEPQTWLHRLFMLWFGPIEQGKYRI